MASSATGSVPQAVGSVGRRPRGRARRALGPAAVVLLSGLSVAAGAAAGVPAAGADPLAPSVAPACTLSLDVGTTMAADQTMASYPAATLECAGVPEPSTGITFAIIDGTASATFGGSASTKTYAVTDGGGVARVAPLVAGPADGTLTVTATSGGSNGATDSKTVSVTGEVSGVLPPANPPADVTAPVPSPPCTSATDSSAPCLDGSIAAIDTGRRAEGLGPLVLPTNWSTLSVPEQLFVLLDLERTARGEQPLAGMATGADQAAQVAAVQARDPDGSDLPSGWLSPDPSGPGGSFSWGGVWAGGYANSLLAVFAWVYDDGYPSGNVDCTGPGATGCWDHRDIVLGTSEACMAPCVMGTGWADGSYTAELDEGYGYQPVGLDVSWSSELPFLPACEAGDLDTCSWSGQPPTVVTSPRQETAPSAGTPVVGMAPTPDGGGYWLVASNGAVDSFGNAGSDGSMGGRPLAAPVVGMAPTPDGGGYWLVAADGGVFAFGDAAFYGSMGGSRLAAPVVGMAPTPDGGGYFLVAADGGVFAFGDAAFYGSMGGRRLDQPVMGMATDPATGGYWLVAADGGVFAFGAPFDGSMGGRVLEAPVVGMTATVNGAGYRLAAGDGGIFDFGVAPFYGSGA